MSKLLRTKAFSDWLLALRDHRARDIITARLRRVANGNVGLARSVGKGVSGLKIDYGPGYRVYFTRRDFELILDRADIVRVMEAYRHTVFAVPPAAQATHAH